MLKRTMGVFMASAVVSAVVLAVGPASAWTQRRAAASCVGGSVSNWTAIGNNSSSTNSLVLACALDSDSDKPHTAITHLNAHIDNTGVSAIANRCVRFFNVSGGACGSSHSSNVAGTITLNPPNSPSSFATNWNNGAHFPYVAIVLPPNAGFKGYYTDNL